MELDPVYFKDAISLYKPRLANFYNTKTPTFMNYRITQGEVGDCWLLSPLSAIARSDALRPALAACFAIRTGRRPADKGYIITLFGKEHITIDGQLYIIPAEGRFNADLLFAGQQQFIPALSSVDNTVLWPAFFEKAAAMRLGGYHQLDGGDPDSPTAKQAADGFQLLTGRAPTVIRPADTTVDAIAAALGRGAAIVFTTRANSAMPPGSTLKTSPQGLDDSTGLNLLEDHAYVVDTVRGDGAIILYNPHGELPHLKHNIAAPLSWANIVAYGARFDILEPGHVGGYRRRTRRRQNRRRSQRCLASTRR